MYSSVVNDSGALRIFQLWSSLYRHYDNFIPLSESKDIFLIQGNSLLFSLSGSVVVVASVSKAVGLSKVVGPGGWCDNTRLNGDEFIDLST